MSNLKQNINNLLFLAKQVDFLLVFLAILILMLLLSYKFFMAITAAYIYTGFYVVIKRIIQGKGVSFLHLFLGFIIGVLIIPGGAYCVLLFFAKGV